MSRGATLLVQAIARKAACSFGTLGLDVGLHRLGRYGALQVLQLGRAMIGGMLRGKSAQPGPSRVWPRCNVMHGSRSDKGFLAPFRNNPHFQGCSDHENMMYGIRSTRREFLSSQSLLGVMCPCVLCSSSLSIFSHAWLRFSNPLGLVYLLAKCDLTSI